jgi:hypothetical protein
MTIISILSPHAEVVAAMPAKSRRNTATLAIGAGVTDYKFPLERFPFPDRPRILEARELILDGVSRRRLIKPD